MTAKKFSVVAKVSRVSEKGKNVSAKVKTIYIYIYENNKFYKHIVKPVAIIYYQLTRGFEIWTFLVNIIQIINSL